MTNDHMIGSQTDVRMMPKRLPLVHIRDMDLDNRPVKSAERV